MSFVVNQQLFELIDSRFRFHNLNIPSGCDTKTPNKAQQTPTNSSYPLSAVREESPSPLRRQRQHQAASSKQPASKVVGYLEMKGWRLGGPSLHPLRAAASGGGAPLPPAGEAKTTDGGRSFPGCKRTPTRPDGETFQSREDHPASSLKPEPPSPLRRLTPYPRLPATVLSPWQGDYQRRASPAGGRRSRPSGPRR